MPTDTTPDPDTPDRDDRLAELLTEFLAAAEAGGPADPAEWAGRHPEFRDELVEFFALRGKLDRLAAARPGAAGGRPTELGGYELLGELGRGGMGVVYRARQPGTGRVVALKVILAGRFAAAAERRRFHAETEAAARLDHPGIVPVYHVGEADGHLFFTMKLLEGGDLRGHLPRLQVDPRAVARLGSALARAVHHAHQRGVLHRDLKPSNVLLDPDGRPHVADFGLARFDGSEGPLTRTGELVGTLPYMAPELADGSAAGSTTAADVYGVGAVLYACLTGRPPGPPGAGGGVPAGPPPPRRLRPAIPRDLEAVCLRCLDGSPRRRYATAADAADDLDRFLAALPTHARPVGPLGAAYRAARRRPRTALLLLVAAAAVAALPAVVTWYSLRLGAEAAARRGAERDAERDRERAEEHEFYATLERVRARRLGAAAGWPGENLADLRRLARLGPAGDHLTDLRTEAATALGAVDLPAPRALAPGFVAYAPAFHPAGGHVALGGWGTTAAGECQVKVVEAAGGAEVRSLGFPTDPEWNARYGRANADGCRAVAYSPDGRWLVAGTRSGRLVRWDLAEADPRPVVWAHAPPGPRPAEENVQAVAFTPDGRVLVSAGHRQVAGWDAGRGWAEAFRAGGRYASVVRPARHTDPLSVLIDAVTGYLVTADPPGLSPTPIHPGGRVAGPGGRWVVAAHPGVEYLLMTHAATEPVREGSFHLPGEERADDGAIYDAAVSPSGEFLAASAEHRRHLKLWSVTSGRVLAARTLTGGSLKLAFHPRGEWLAVAADTGTLLYPLPRDRVSEPVGVGPASLSDADLTPDGSTGVTIGSHPVWPRIARWSADGRGEAWYDPDQDRNEDNNRTAAITPDGRSVGHPARGQVVFRGPPGVVRNDAATTSLRDLRADPAGRVWSACGEGLRAWDPVTGAPAARGHRPPVGRYDCVAPGAEWVWAGRTDGAVCRHPVAGGPAGAVVPAFSTAVAGIAQSADGRVVVAGSVTGGVAVIGAGAGAVTLDRPAAHQDAVPAVAIGPGGWFVSGSRDRMVKLWSASGQLVMTLPQSRAVRRVFVSADGRFLTVLAEGERGLRRWNLDRLHAELAALGLDYAGP